jgi:hypothetical protein
LKINGEDIAPLPISTVVLPRGDKDYVFRAQPVLDYTEMKAILPEPSAPFVSRPGSPTPVADPDAPGFKKAVEDYAERRTQWMFLKSLEATPGLTWETVDMEKPETWSNWQEELTDANFSALEVTKIMEIVIEANGLNEDKIKVATDSFLRSGQPQ